jgi:hypothetical protein
MTRVIEKIKNKIYEEKLLEIYSGKQSILDVLKCAYAQELHFIRGAYLNSGTVLISAASDNITGLWEICLEVDHGKVIYNCMDAEGNNMNIYSIPSDKYIKDKENLSESEIKAIQIQASNSIDIDLRDTRSLKKAKDLFKRDYVLKHIPLYHLEADDAARFLIWHIRAYRKVFLEYQRTFKFLWEGTSFKNARSLVEALLEKNLVDKSFFEIEQSEHIPGAHVEIDGVLQPIENLQEKE